MAAAHEVALDRATTDTQKRLDNHVTQNPRDQEIILCTVRLIEETRAFLRSLPPIERAFQAWQR